LDDRFRASAVIVLVIWTWAILLAGSYVYFMRRSFAR